MIPVMKKLKSKSGISLAIALVFFLLCAMVGTVVLSAATVSAGNTARERQLYRETLAMTSAAQLLRQEFQTIIFQGSFQKIETVTTDSSQVGKTKVTTAEDLKKGDPPVLSDGTLFTISNLPIGELYYSKQENLTDPPAIPTPVVQNLKVQADTDRNVPEVNGEITVATDYTITVVLQCGQNSMTMTFPASTDVGTAISDPTVAVSGSTSTKTTVTTYTTTVTWNAPTVREGGTVS